jgi:spermidine synthase
MAAISTPAAPPRVDRGRPLLLKLLPVLVAASGASALIYESLWMRSFGLIFGNTTYAVSVILATFMGGMAAGSFLATRLKLNRILVVYAMVELAIGLTALGSFFVLRELPDGYAAVLGGSASPAMEVFLRILLASVIILPTTLFAGMTFPLLVEFLTRRTRDLRANLSFLYFVNTLGGAVGAFACVFVLLPAAGVFAATLTAVALNLTVGILVWIFSASAGEDAPSSAAPVPAAASAPASSPVEPAAGRGAGRWFLSLAFASGFVSFSLETLWTRSYALVIGSSVYAFNIMLISVLLGIIIGTYVYEKVFPRIRRSSLWIACLLLAMGVFILIGVAVIGRLPVVFFWFMKAVPVSFGAYQAIGFGICFLTMLPVTALFGFLFPLFIHQAREGGHTAQELSGKLYGWNTLGAIAGALLTGFLFIPLSGLQTPYVWMSGVVLLLGWLVLGPALSFPVPVRAAGAVVLLAPVVLLSLWYKPWDPLTITSGIYKYGIEFRNLDTGAGKLFEQLRQTREVLFYSEGRECTVTVTRTVNENYLAVNGKGDASTDLKDAVTQKLIAHVPLMLHPDPRTALIIGWGSGCTAGTAGMYDLEAIECAEIEPACFEARQYFTAVNRHIDRDPRFHIVFKDGRNYLLTSRKKYDVIMSEPSNPWISGINNLFTADCYRIILSHLDRNGIFCQWFHFYDMNLEDIRVQIRTFLSVFPEASLWSIPSVITAGGNSSVVGDILLIGSREPVVPDFRRMESRFAVPAIGEDLFATGVLLDPLSFISSLIMLREDMARFAGNGPLNTDDTPWIEIQGPKGLYFLSKEAEDRKLFTIFKSFESSSAFVAPPVVHYPPLAPDAPADTRARALVELGRAYQKRIMFAKAQAAFREAVRLDPAYAPAYAALGNNQCLLGNDVEEGIKNSLQAIRLDPTLKHPHEVLATIYLQRQDFQKAGEICRTLIERFPAEYSGYYGMAYILARQGDVDGARGFAARAYELNPEAEAVRNLYAQVQQAN